MASTPKYPHFEKCKLDGESTTILISSKIYSNFFNKMKGLEQKKSPQIALRGPFTFFLLTQFLYLHVI
jgi:hypothetical protein